MNRSYAISEDLLSRGFNVRVTTRGSSMFPLIATGDRITISPDINPDIGDVIAYKSHGDMICHRLMKVFEKDGIRYYRTLGDNCSGLDEPVTSDQIVGKVTGIKRERVSLARRVLLFVYPVLRFGRLNVMVISALIMARNIFKRRRHNTV